jgi:hypothetical protein
MVDLASVVRPGDGIIWGQSCAEPQTLVESLVAQRARLGKVGCFLGASYSGLVRPEHADYLRLSSYCGTGTNRALVEAGVLDILPAPYSRLGALIRNRSIACDVAMVQVSPPNARGEYSLGLGVEYLAPAIVASRAVIAEVNAQVPWTYTEPLLRREDFDLVVESSRAPVYLPSAPFGQIEKSIAAHAAAFIPEGAVIECGLGTLPAAIVAGLAGRRGLHFHTGLIPEAAVVLVGLHARLGRARQPAALRRDQLGGGGRLHRAGERRSRARRLRRRGGRLARLRARGEPVARRRLPHGLALGQGRRAPVRPGLHSPQRSGGVRHRARRGGPARLRPRRARAPPALDQRGPLKLSGRS